MKSILTVLLIGITFLTTAQNPAAINRASLEKYIPKDAAFVATINPQFLNKKVNLKQLQQYEFYDMMMMQMGMEMGATDGIGAAIMANEADTGVNLMQSGHFFGEYAGDKFNMGIILKLSDSQKFKNFLFTEGTWKDIEVSNWEGYQYAVPQKDMVIAWNDNLVFIGGSEFIEEEEAPYIYEEYAEEEMEIEESDVEFEEMETEEELEEIIVEETEIIETPINDEKDMLLRAASLNVVQNSLKLPFNESILSVTKYGLAKKHFDDAHFYMDYGWLMKFLQDQQSNNGGFGGSNPFGFGMNEYMEMMQGLMGTMYEDSGLSVGFNFNNGDISMDTRMYSSGSYMNLSRKMFDSKFNKKFSKYLKGGEILGFWNFNMSTEGLIDGYKTMAYDMAKTVPGYGDLGKSAIELIGIVIDEEAIANVLTGNVVMAVTGMQEVTRMQTTYEYDEEFNSTEIQEEVTSEIPVFTMMAEYGNEKDLMKFIRLGINSTFVKPERDYFVASIPEVGDFYMAMNKGIFFLSNDEDLIKNRLDSGYKKRERISIDQCKMMAKNAQVLYWDIPNTMTAFNAEEAAGMMGAGDFVNMGRQNFKSITMTTSKYMDTSLNTSMKINLTNKNENSLKVLFDLINEAFSGMMGGGKT